MPKIVEGSAVIRSGGKVEAEQPPKFITTTVVIEQGVTTIPVVEGLPA